MSNTDPTSRRPRVDVEPAASGFPAIPIPASAGVAGDEADSYQRGAAEMGLAVLRALEQGHVPEVMGTLRPLTYRGSDCAGVVLRSLRPFADRPVEGGGRS